MMDTKERYPILFGRRELIEGNGFVAGVDVNGRALLTREGDEYWVEGVNPGGFAARGASPSEALAAFCDEHRVVLFDIASDARDFTAFKAGVEIFFQETNETALQEWNAEIETGHVKRMARFFAILDCAKSRLPQL